MHALAVSIVLKQKNNGLYCIVQVGVEKLTDFLKSCIKVNPVENALGKLIIFSILIHLFSETQNKLIQFHAVH